MTSLAEELPNKINRVRAVQNSFKELIGVTIVEPQIAMMEESIQMAIKSLTSGDVLEMLRCYEDLKGWSA